MEFSREEYSSDWPFPSPENLPNPGVKPRFLALQAYSLPSEPLGMSFGYLKFLILIFFPFYKNIVPQWIMTTHSPSSSSTAVISFIIDHLISISSLLFAVILLNL